MEQRKLISSWLENDLSSEPRNRETFQLNEVARRRLELVAEENSKPYYETVMRFQEAEPNTSKFEGRILVSSHLKYLNNPRSQEQPEVFEAEDGH